MAEGIHCVFIPPNFFLKDVMSIVFISEEKKKLVLEIDNVEFDLGEGNMQDGKIIWPIDTFGEFESLSENCKLFRLCANEEKLSFDLSQLTFLGPVKGSSPPSSVFLLEFTSGYYCRSDDYSSETVSFSVDSILTLDYRNVAVIRKQIEELSVAKAKFEETKKSLTESGIDLNELAQLKDQYEESMKKKRRIQHEFVNQNHKMAANTIQLGCEQDRQLAIETLKKHIEANQQRLDPPEPSADSYYRLLNFREAALKELKSMFPFDIQMMKMCSVVYTQQPININQWNENRAFLGFATHYIREISRILGIPLHYLLVPLSVSSKAIYRINEERRLIPVDMSAQNKIQMAQYEEALVSCCIHIEKTLIMEQLTSSSILEHINKLNSITKENLETLVPEYCRKSTLNFEPSSPPV